MSPLSRDFGRCLGLALVAVALCGCGVGSRIGNQMDGTFGEILLSRSEQVKVQLEADPVLNPNAAGEPLSVVVRIYQLDALDGFATVDPGVLWQDPAGALGTALLSQRELTLLPAGSAEDIAPMAERAQYIGIAAFFRQTPDDRWRVAFPAAALRKDGIFRASDGLRLRLVGERIETLRGDDLFAAADD